MQFQIVYIKYERVELDCERDAGVEGGTRKRSQRRSITFTRRRIKGIFLVSFLLQKLNFLNPIFYVSLISPPPPPPFPFFFFSFLFCISLLLQYLLGQFYYISFSFFSFRLFLLP